MTPKELFLTTFTLGALTVASPAFASLTLKNLTPTTIKSSDIEIDCHNQMGPVQAAFDTPLPWSFTKAIYLDNKATNITCDIESIENKANVKQLASIMLQIQENYFKISNITSKDPTIKVTTIPATGAGIDVQLNLSRAS